MKKRTYTKIEIIEPEIIAMRAAGKLNREIAEHFGLKLRQIEQWVTRYNCKQAKIAAGIIPRPKGRPRKDAMGLLTKSLIEKANRFFLLVCCYLL